MFDNTRIPTSGVQAPRDLQPAGRALDPVAPLPQWLAHKVGDASQQSAVRGTASAAVTINGTYDARKVAAVNLSASIDKLVAARKLDPQGAALLRRIAADPSVSEQRLRLLTEGISHLGKPYNWGSTGPKQFDCSGLAGFVYKRSIGTTLPRTSFFQHRAGTTVARTDLKPGDLVFFGGKKVTHVAIYLGNGMMLEAGGEGRVSTNKGSVRIRPLRADYKGARRFIDDAKAGATMPKPTFGERMYRSIFDWPLAQKLTSWL